MAKNIFSVTRIAPPNRYTNSNRSATGRMVTVILEFMGQRMRRMERPSISPMSREKYFSIVSIFVSYVVNNVMPLRFAFPFFRNS